MFNFPSLSFLSHINMALSARLKSQLSEFYYEVLGGGKMDKTWKRVQREFPGEYTRKQVKEFIDT